jgi:SAM-dependent methyltransferase
MPAWIRKTTLEPLTVSMSGVKLADRVLIIGCADPRLIARLGAKAGLTGRACAVDETEALVTEAARITEREGVLIETAHAPGWQVSYSNDSFDVVVVRELGSALRTQALHEAHRILRPGGRAVAILGGERRGVGALFSKRTIPDANAVTGTFTAAGFLAVRTLAEREGLLFVEGVKKNL